VASIRTVHRCAFTSVAQYVCWSFIIVNNYTVLYIMLFIKYRMKSEKDKKSSSLFDININILKLYDVIVRVITHIL